MVTPNSPGKLTVLDAPSNLGLSPPQAGTIPGCYKLPWALRDRGLIKLLRAEDGGCLVPPRYRAQWQAGEGDRNAEAIAGYSISLADRLQPLIEQAGKVLVLGGDCSILLGNMLALKRLGRYGLVFLDAHSDFRHPGNDLHIRAAAGEDLAIVTGRGDARLINLQGLGPYVEDQDVHVVGIRGNDEYLQDLAATRISMTTSEQMPEAGTDQLVDEVLATVTRHTAGFWIHLDLDVVDASEMFAVDCPEPEGPSFATITTLLRGLFESPKCIGIDLTIYDPDLDPTGVCADRIVRCLTRALCCNA
ncbi:arginase family protein [Pseudomonas fluorescens]|uniref:Arginase n=1 Tax=Pseudomonas fluorescens TaxID=294 RepID=A0A5E7DLD9_PSEFL|nr:arginase family protein [Pseudomonas fluorescens]VVO08072.1 Arginase [Pseudomonas fluorescens]